MKEKRMKIFCAMLSLFMMICSAEFSVYAKERGELSDEAIKSAVLSEGEGEQESGFDENAHGKIMVDAVAGEPKYRVYEDKTLYIYGNGIWENKYRYDNISSVYMEDTITEIGEGAFLSYNDLINIRLSENIEKIGDNAFWYCNFETIDIPDKATTIGVNAFYKCENLKNIILPENLIELKKGAFQGCKNLESIEVPERIKDIGEYVFDGCNKLKEIKLPKSLEFIGENAFRGCDNLTVYCSSATVAEQYARENNISFELLNHTHKYDTSTTKEPTCIETGIKKYICSCGNSYTEEIPATGHKEVIDYAISPTEKENGKTEGRHCSVCGEILKKQEIIPATGKKEENTEKKDYKEGDIVYKDRNIIIVYDGISGDEYDYDINFTVENLTGKTLEVQVMESSINGFMVDPICSIEISPYKKAQDNASIWGDDAKRIPKSNVKYMETRFRIFDWNDYDFGYSTDFIKMLNTHTHSYNTEKVQEEPTCTKNGIMKCICSCGSYQTKPIYATGHTYSSWETISEPNCLNEGKKYKYCKECYEYFYESIPIDKNSHTWSIWRSVSKPTALKFGKKKRECYTCQKEETMKIEKLKAKITISNKKKTLKAGKSFTLKLKKYTYGDKISKFTSNNKKVATVNSKGKVIGKKKGKAKITVKMKSGCKATCTVTVK